MHDEINAALDEERHTINQPVLKADKVRANLSLFVLIID